MLSLEDIFHAKKRLLHFLICFSLANVFLYLLLGLKYINYIFSSETLFETSFYVYTSILGKLFVLFVNLCSYIGHFSLLAFLPCLLLIPCVFLLHRALIFALAIMLWAMGAIILIIDNVLFSLFHFHLNLTILGIAFSKDYPIIKFLELTQTEILVSMLIIAFIFLLESSIAFLIWQKIILKKRSIKAKKITFMLGSSLVISYMGFILTISENNNVFALQTPNLPFYNNILASILPIKDSFDVITRYSETRFAQPLFPVSTLHYPLQSLQCVKTKAQKNIVIIAIDTWRYDALNEELTPNLQQFANKAWQFKSHYSGGNSTQAGLFSLFYGLPATYWESMRTQKRGAIFFDELLKQGYQTKIIFSSEMVPPFDQTIFYKVPHLRRREAPGETVPDHDKSITLEFQDFLAKRDKARPFFTFLFYDSAHGYYLEQNIPKLYPTKEFTLDRLLRVETVEDLNLIKNRYKNAVHFIDAEIKKVIDTLQNQGLLQDSVVIITSDHGEEFNDNHKDFVGHGSNYTAYQIRTPFIVWWPDSEPRIFTHQTSHYDVVPTLMKQILGCMNSPDDYSVGKDLLNTQDKPYLLVGSYINMGVIEKNKITTLLTSGSIQVTDEAMHQLSAKDINRVILSQALAEMRRFYT